MASPLPNAKVQFTDSNGAPLVGGKVYTYAAGLGTPKATYTTKAATVENTNPVVLDARGEADIWLGDGGYKIVLKTASDVTLWTVDNVESTGDLQSAVLGQLAASSGSSLVGFLQSGSGVVARTVQAKLRDSVSVKDFGAVGDGTTNDTAALQSAFNYAATNNITVTIPSGSYLVSTEIVVTGKIKIQGDIGSRLFTNTNISVLHLNGYNTSFSVIDHLEIQGPGTSTSTVPGLKLTNANTVKMRLVKVHAFDTGVRYYAGAIAPQSCYLCSMYDCLIISNKTYNIYGESNTNALHLYNCTIGGGPCATGMYLVNSGSLTVLGGDAEGLTQCVFDLDSTAALTARHTICGFHFEDNTSAVGDIRIGNTAAVNGTSVIGCFFKPGGSSYAAVNAVRGEGLAIIGGGLNSGYLSAPNGFTLIGPNFGHYDILGIGGSDNLRNDSFINYRTKSGVGYSGLGPTAFDAAYSDGARYNLYAIKSGDVAASKNYYSALSVARIEASTAPGSGNAVYALGAIASNAYGAAVNTRAIRASGALDLTQVILAYSASITPNAAEGNSFVITANNTSAFTINAPINPATGQEIVITIKNASGGALGVITWNAVFKKATFTSPANGFNRSIRLRYDGTNWCEVRDDADVPN